MPNLLTVSIVNYSILANGRFFLISRKIYVKLVIPKEASEEGESKEEVSDLVATTLKLEDLNKRYEKLMSLLLEKLKRSSTAQFCDPSLDQDSSQVGVQ